MTIQHRTDAIRQLVRDTFSQMGAEQLAEIDESILIRDGHYCGHRLECDGLHAVWFVEENQVKFYQRNGSLSEVRSTAPAIQPSFRDETQQRVA